ncbi:hypothetical protein BDI_1435 [Parabacteroides distasonis ATCC 8503]|uniref:Uncharacterized protein n=1 Tax=Parabacteroides distasonis (strain ATCC 8503 / DSM 20701 / CIP 104284 / JCM 5825 / NCTC 11152) TaxID=435591 RepID=A6LBX8_PARD8|nr:hypothetical protein BDI_1435 [Parabacteroides distasonis ATCC 8503]
MTTKIERIYELTINLKLFTRLLPHPIQVAHLLLDMYNYNCSRYNCSCPQVINILFAIYMAYLLLDLFPKDRRGMYRPRRDLYIPRLGLYRSRRGL